MVDLVLFLVVGISIVDVVVWIIDYFKDIKTSSDAIDDDIEGLIDEIKILMTVHEQLEQVYLKNINNNDLEEKDKLL